MGAKSRGTARERKVIEWLVGRDFVVYRSAGSHGCGDLVAMRHDCPPLIVQVKASAGGPWEHFRPAERQALYAEARQAGADAILAWWPSRKPLRWYAGPNWLEVNLG